MKHINIKGRLIGDGYPAYIIVEMSANHSGSIERAKEIIRTAKECGADCIKIQTYTPDTLTIDCHNEYFRVQNGTWEGENLYSLYGKAFTPWEWQSELKAEADKVGIDFLSTPFDTTSVDFLEEIGLEFYKIASFEIVDLPLIKYIASKGKPIIMSTGMATKEEISEALEVIYEMGNEQVVILKCSSAYPAISDDMHLKTITDMKNTFQIPVGLSDHSLGHLGATTAIALGANVIEKHFCMSREIKNPDASFSMEPHEFKEMVDQIRQVETAMGEVYYGVSENEKSSMVFRRSIFVTKEIKKGELLSEENIKIIRPGYGEKPKYYNDILGARVEKDIDFGTPFSFDLLCKKSILFLTNNEKSKELYEWLKAYESDKEVYCMSNKITLDIVRKMQPEFIISYNYRHIISKEVLDYMNGRAINLHVSFLPYNRGSSPNFFSFLDNTPKGVTIHEMTAALDKGRILAQKELTFNEETETFSSSYQRLQEEICELFKNNWDLIKNNMLEGFFPEKKGTYHTMKELDAFRKEHPFSWDDCIADFKRKWNLE